MLLEKKKRCKVDEMADNYPGNNSFPEYPASKTNFLPHPNNDRKLKLYFMKNLILANTHKTLGGLKVQLINQCNLQQENRENNFQIKDQREWQENQQILQQK